MATITTASGLNYEDLRVGEGATARFGSDVLVHYTGWLASGAKFDSSRDRNEPFGFGARPGQRDRRLGGSVAGMRVGGRRKLVIPPDLGYGAWGPATSFLPTRRWFSRSSCSRQTDPNASADRRAGAQLLQGSAKGVPSGNTTRTGVAANAASVRNGSSPLLTIWWSTSAGSTIVLVRTEGLHPAGDVQLAASGEDDDHFVAVVAVRRRRGAGIEGLQPHRERAETVGVAGERAMRDAGQPGGRDAGMVDDVHGVLPDRRWRRGPVGAKAVALPCCNILSSRDKRQKSSKARNIADNLSAIVHPS